MSITHNIAQGFALYFLTTGVAIIFNRRVFQLSIQDLMNSPGCAYLSALLTLILGIFLVMMHNIWVEDWPVLITILVWVTLIKGIWRVVYPQIDEVFMSWMESDKLYTFAGIYALLLGATLAVLSFTLFQ